MQSSPGSANFRIKFLSRCGDGLDLDQEIRTVEFGNLDQGDGRSGRRRDRRKEPVSGFAVQAEVIHVGQKYREFHQIRWIASALAQGDAEVLKDLGGLRCKIALADQMTITVERGLTGDEDHAAGPYLDNLRVAGRGAAFRRIAADDR